MIPIVSGHTRLRWLDRSDAPSLEPSIAWREATRIPGEEFGVEARYHAAADVVLLRSGGTITTALDGDVGEDRARDRVEEIAADGGRP